MRVSHFVILLACAFLIASIFTRFLPPQAARQSTTRYTDVNFQEINQFAFDQVKGKLEDIPKDIRSFDGRKISLIGYMWQPRSDGRSVTEFDLVEKLWKSSGTPPLIQWLVQAKVKPGVVAHYYAPQVKVSGTMHVSVTHDQDGRISGIYQLDVDSVEPIEAGK